MFRIPVLGNFAHPQWHPVTWLFIHFKLCYNQRTHNSTPFRMTIYRVHVPNYLDTIYLELRGDIIRNLSDVCVI